MAKFLQRIFSSLKLDRRDWAVLLLSLLLAFSIWLIHNLSLKYNDIITVPVRAKCGIEGYSELSSNSVDITGRCRAIGFNLIGAKMFARHDVRVVPFDREALHPKGEGVFYMTMKELQEHAHLIFGDAMTLDYFVTDTVEFRFARESSKKVPVELYGGFEMDPEYMALSEVRLIPDSVTVFGDESLLASVRSVSTSRIFRSGVHKDMSGTLKLRNIKGLRVSDEQVRYELKVVRFVEISREVPVRVFSRPDGKDCIVIPSTVNVVCKCPFPYQQDPFDGAVFGIEYSDYVSSRSGMCRVSGRNLSDGVISYTVEPEIVQCVVGEQ